MPIRLIALFLLICGGAYAAAPIQFERTSYGNQNFSSGSSSGGGSTSPGGVSGSVQFNNSGSSFGGDSTFTYAGGALTVPLIDLSAGTSNGILFPSGSVLNDVGGFLSIQGQTKTQLGVSGGPIAIGNTSKISINAGGVDVAGTADVGIVGTVSVTGLTGIVTATNGYFANISTSTLTTGNCIGCGSISNTQNAAGNISSSIGIGFNAAVGTGLSNTSVGARALNANTSGADVTAIGAGALRLNSTGSNNTAVGELALGANQTGLRSTAIGALALTVATGNDNVAIGYNANSGLSTGIDNTGVGSGVGGWTTGSDNVAVGFNTGNTISGASRRNTLLGSGIATGNGGVVTNTVAIGYNSIFSITNATDDVVIGTNSGLSLTSGSSNTLIGYNVANTLTTGSNNIAIGTNADVQAATGGFQLNIGKALYGNIGSGAGLANLLGVNVLSPTASLEVSGTISTTTLTVGPGGCSGCGSGQISTTTLTAAGAVTFTTPAGTTTSTIYEVWATGSGGGSAGTGVGNFSATGGGGGGASCYGTFTGIAAGTALSGNIGSAGSAGSSGGNGGNGGDTTFTEGVNTITATGGGASSTDNSVALIIGAGGRPGLGSGSTPLPGGFCNDGGTGSNGIGLLSTQTLGGAGGSTIWGGGVGPTRTPAAFGSGGPGTQGSSSAGTAGATGVIMIRFIR